MKIKSPAFLENQLIPPIYACDGDNINPPLEIYDTPPNAQSLALIMDDPDAPGGTFTHWLIWNIPPQTKGLLENEISEGVEEGTNDGGQIGYMGPCPPEGTHRYFFKLYALDKRLSITPNIKRLEFEKEIGSSVIAKCEYVGIYTKSS